MQDFEKPTATRIRVTLRLLHMGEPCEPLELMAEEPEGGVTVADVLQAYAREHDALVPPGKKSSLLVFVNGVMAKREYRLADGDSVTVARLRGGG